MPSKNKEYINPTEFLDFLNNEKGERGISDFIKKQPQILYWTLCRAGGHSRFVFREFPIGNSFVADFVILNSYSGVWEVYFIELEPVDAKIFTKSGVPAARLAGAIKQIDDWADYFDKNKSEIRSELVRWAKTKDLLKYSDGKNPCNFSGQFLSNPQTNLFEKFFILIGRRNSINSDEQNRKGQLVKRRNVEVISYDRLLDLVSDRYSRTI